ncbi:glycosyltransferase family 39 protein, partial [Candidatus Woesebacteria bacterium]|nr:glycosyltransferase family 39 protein [Candidatus Woesebacteria bacterium]
SGKLFLIGPTTGIAGIFRGPFYYYLIAPFYLLGGGDPVYPAVFLSALSVGAIWVLYHIAARYLDKVSAILVVVLSSFSFFIVMASRWLSNPTPMLFLSAFLVWMVVLVTKGKRWAWVAISLIIGLSIFHFGSAGEIFYIPAILMFALWQRKNLPNMKIFLLSVLVFISTIIPQVIFDIRHEGILRSNISNFVVKEKSFGMPTLEEAKDKLTLYSNIVTSEIFHTRGDRELAILITFLILFLIFFPILIKKDIVKILCLLLLSVGIGLFFFKGNEGVVYDYYLTGYYLFPIFLLAILLAHLWKFKFGKIFVIYFLYLFLTNNLSVTWYRLSDKGDNENSVAYLNQKKAIDWIYDNSKGEKFNIDVYVPPVVPYAYDYLFLWYGGELKGRIPEKENSSLLYTISEVDPPHPERLGAWVKRQEGIAKIEASSRFGGITVERRRRI